MIATVAFLRGWILDLLTTYTHNSERPLITAPLLISTLYKSPQQMGSFFQPAIFTVLLHEYLLPWECVYRAVPYQRPSLLAY
jgi:hypothetical protein